MLRAFHTHLKPSRFVLVATLLVLLIGSLWSTRFTGAVAAEPVLVKTVGRCEKAQTVAAGERYFFIGDTSEHGCELWVSDGTEAGTRLVKDIWPGPSSGVGAEFAPPTLTYANGLVYFMAHDGTHGYELWKSDGTAAGTTLVKDILVGECQSGWSIWDDGCSSFAGWNGLAVLGNTLFFIAEDTSGMQLWRTNGTASGTMRITSLGANAPIAASNFVFFIGSGNTLWRSDGTPGGTELIRDGLSSLYLTPMVALGDRLFFAASEGTRGVELWSSDGTREGTDIVRDIRPGLYASRPFELTAVGNQLFFMIEGETHYELWKSDGSAAGTVQVATTPMPVGSYVPSDLTAVGSHVYFSAMDVPQGDYKLWTSDGTAAGTRLVSNRVSNPRALTAFNDLLLFSGYISATGYELWQSDGTEAMTFMVKEFCAGTILSPADPCHGGPSEITKVGTRVFMHAYPSYRNAALYTYVPRNELPATPTPVTPTPITPTPVTPTPVDPSTPQLNTNHADGAPGSSFLINAAGFPAGARVQLSVNGTNVGTPLTVGNDGLVRAILQTAAGAAPGRYRVMLRVVAQPTALHATNSAIEASTSYTLAASAPLREPPDGVAVPMLDVPANIPANASGVYLPLVQR